MISPQWFQYTMTGFLGIAAAAALIGVAYSQFRKGSRTESGEIVEFYKNQANNFKEIAETTRKEYTLKHEELLKEVGVLRGELNTERKLREQYEAILKDRNPETTEFMKTMLAIGEQATKFMDAQSKNNLEVARILGEIHTMVQSDLKVEATVTKQ